MIYARLCFGVSAANSAAQTSIKGIRRMSLTDTPTDTLANVRIEGNTNFEFPTLFLFSQALRMATGGRCAATVRTTALAKKQATLRTLSQSFL